MNQRGVLLMNLGSPDSTAVPDVRRYLDEFLMDPRVIDLAWPLRALVVRGFILPFRPRKSAEAYEKIWTPAGSPLVVTSRQLQRALESTMSLPVELAMRYRKPSVDEALRNLVARGVRDVALVPLFPHYAMSSFETAVVHVEERRQRIAPTLNLSVAKPYFDDAGYIDALVASAREDLAQPYDHLLFSFHGIPERHVRKTDPTGCHCLASSDCCDRPGPSLATCYRAQCFATAAAFVRKHPVRSWSVSFQSRLGRDPWLKPYTDFEYVRFAQEGVKRLLVICPAFVADCLETLEEIAMRGKESFIGAGGGELRQIPCMNVRPEWVSALAGIAGGVFAGRGNAAVKSPAGG